MNARKAGFIVAAALACGCAWAGPAVEATLTLGNDTEGIASDPVLAQTYVTNQADGTVSVINMNTRTVVATIHAGTNPHRIIADAATHRVYLTNATTPGTVTVIDGTKNAVVATIPVGNDPEGIGSNLFIGHVYVSNNGSNSVSVINTASNAVVATIPVGTSPLSPNSNDILKKLYVASFTGHGVEDIATFAGMRPITFPAWDNLPDGDAAVDEIAGQRRNGHGDC